MKLKLVFQSLIVLTLLFSPLGNIHPSMGLGDAEPAATTDVNPSSIELGKNATVIVSLSNVPEEGYASAEFTCTYDASLMQVSNVTVTSLFGLDAAVAINDPHPQGGSFIVAIAGSNGNKATTSGTAFTFPATGLQAGQSAIECTVRVSKGDNALTSLPSNGTNLTIVGSLPTATATQTPTPFDTPTPSDTATPTSLTPADTATPTSLTPVDTATPTSLTPVDTATPTSLTPVDTATQVNTPIPTFTSTPVEFANPDSSARRLSDRTSPGRQTGHGQPLRSGQHSGHVCPRQSGWHLQPDCSHRSLQRGGDRQWLPACSRLCHNHGWQYYHETHGHAAGRRHRWE